MKSVVCPYCQSKSKLVGGDVIYPRRPDLKSLKFWHCTPCDAYVGCHKEGARVETKNGLEISDGTIPLGRLADAALRRAKRTAHAAFDPIWSNGLMKRKSAYSWLAKEMKINVHDCHIGDFTVAQCELVVKLANQLTQKQNNRCN